MHMGKTEEDIDPIQIECNGSYLQQVQTYEYLGRIIQQNGKNRKEIINRLEKLIVYYIIN